MDTKVFLNSRQSASPLRSRLRHRYSFSARGRQSKAKLIKTQMLRTHTCGQLRLSDVNKTVTLTGWVQRSRDKGSLLWIDLRDRYGITQLILEEAKTGAEFCRSVEASDANM